MLRLHARGESSVVTVLCNEANDGTGPYFHRALNW